MANDERKADFLRECMSDPALVDRPTPIDQFCRSFCVVCGNKECTRSRANLMSFTARAAEWEDRMFNKVPRAAPNDEKFTYIRSKNFRQTNVEVLTIHSQPILETVHSNSEQEPKGIKVEMAPTIDEKPASVPAKISVIDNTPMQAGMILPGKPVDKKEDQFLQSGSSFSFESDDE